MSTVFWMFINSLILVVGILGVLTIIAWIKTDREFNAILRHPEEKEKKRRRK